jgi:hypothetical protein
MNAVSGAIAADMQNYFMTATDGGRSPSGESGRGREPKSGWSLGGDLTGQFNATATGMAAFGSGLEAEKGLYNSDSAVNFVTVAYGLNASADTSVLSVSYHGSSADNPIGVTQGFGLSADFHDIFGGAISIQYVPPSNFNLSFSVGIGAGVGFSVYSIGKTIPGG